MRRSRRMNPRRRVYYLGGVDGRRITWKLKHRTHWTEARPLSGRDVDLAFSERRTRTRGRTARNVSELLAAGQQPSPTPEHVTVALAGHPNVGKSVIFNALTGLYATVSNYPGTTVEVSRGQTKIDSLVVDVVDTPGAYSLLPVTGEERVTQEILLWDRPDIVVSVVDSKNLDRMLPFTLELIESRLQVIVALNMADEARRLGLLFDVQGLSRRLGVPVVHTVATKGIGIRELKREILRWTRRVPGSRPRPKGRRAPARTRLSVRYPQPIETALRRIQQRHLPTTGPVKRTADRGAAVGRRWDDPARGRSLALLLLQGDRDLAGQLDRHRPGTARSVGRIRRLAALELGDPVEFVVAAKRYSMARRIAGLSVRRSRQRPGAKISLLDRLLIHPALGLPVLGVVLYFGLYRFVGLFGAVTLVDFMERTVFDGFVSPWARSLAESYVPWEPLVDLLVGEFGVITLGVRYATAIVMPIVATFFMAFSVLEDSGYLPRLALLANGALRRIGLNGRAVIPLSLGFGCGTMGAIVTRTLEAGRDRFLATFLLALAIPCSAQLGVITALLAGRPAVLLAWGATVAGTFLVAGALLDRLLPGSPQPLSMELPPMRVPRLPNILAKTYARVYWYFWEVFPIFISTSACVWAARRIGLLDLAVGALVRPLRALGLPPDAAVAFIFGFFRRDYGAAGLYDLAPSLSERQLLVTATALTLFTPCIAQLSVILKERGVPAALVIVASSLLVAFGAALTLNVLVGLTGVFGT